MDEAQRHANDVETPAAPAGHNALFRPPSEMAQEEVSRLTDAIVACTEDRLRPRNSRGYL